MTQIDIISGFLGAGKTTLIKKLLDEAFHGQKIVLIENEFGEIGIDGGFLKDAGVEITEMNSGCICCSLVGDFGAALKQVLADYAPDRIVIEPSGVGKLSDVIAAVERVQKEAPALQLHSFVTVVDATKAKIYMKNFGEFFNDQVEHASAILLSRTQNMDQAKLNAAVSLLRNKNPKAAILTTPWEQLTGDQIVSAMEGGRSLKDAGVEITEMNSGCICCSLVGDFGAALKQVLADYAPDRIVIEPSGVGKLSDVIAAVERVQKEAPALQLHSFVTVVDATKAKIYMKNFGEFFNDQVEHASAILLSRTQNMDQAKLNAAVSLLRNKNPKAAILTTPWEQLTGDQIVSAMEGGRSLAEELLEEIGHSHGGDEAHHHHHHEHHDGEGCSCGHDHHDHEHHDEHDHHGHDHCHDEAACDVCLGHEHGHEHHHDHDEAACDACCGHHHHHGHDADEVFTSWGRETPRKYSREDLQDALSALAMSEDYGYILRAKGMVPCDDGQTWLHFDLVPEEFQIREGAADYTGRLCVIGSGLDEAGLEKLFQLV